MKWKKVSSEYISRHRYFTARKDVCEMPGGQIVPAYYVVEMPVSVCAVALSEDGNVLLARQYRYPVDAILNELPGGFVDPGEDPQQAIARELLEETGYEFLSVEYLGQVAANPGVLNNFTQLFLARGGRKVAKQNLDEHEAIDILEIPLEEVRIMLQRNEFVQALHTCCLMYAFQKLDLEK